MLLCFFFSSRRRHTRFDCDWSSDVCSSDLGCWVRDFRHRWSTTSPRSPATRSCRDLIRFEHMGNGTLIEKRSIDYVPLAERHGEVWHLWPVWFSGDAHLATLAVGVLGITLGGNLLWTAVAVVAGCLLGTFFMAFHSTQGPQLGLPQMIQSRPQFGYRGALLVWAAALVAYIGFNAFNQVLAAQALHRSEEHTSELQSQSKIVCRLLLEKKKQLLSNGSWSVDPARSAIEFRVKHMLIQTVKGRFRDFDGAIVAGPRPTVSGSIRVASLET